MKKVMGIDLGGTKIYGGLLDEEGNIIRQKKVDTGSNTSPGLVINKIVQLIKEVKDKDEIHGIGLGSPGFIDSHRGRVLDHGGNIKDWVDFDLKGDLSREFPNLPIKIENDANLAAIGEKWKGAGQDLDSFVMLTLGTGVGGGLFFNESGIHRGDNFQGGELGHAILYPNGILCNCGQRGCLEQYISGRALERSYMKKSGTFKKGALIFSSGDKEALEVVESFIDDLGNFLLTIKNILDPSGLIIGGGVINSREFWWDKLLQAYKEKANNPRTMKILPAKYLNEAGMIGAAKVILDEIQRG